MKRKDAPAAVAAVVEERPGNPALGEQIDGVGLPAATRTVEVRVQRPLTRARKDIAIGATTSLREDQAQRLQAQGIVEIIQTPED